MDSISHWHQILVFGVVGPNILGNWRRSGNRRLSESCGREDNGKNQDKERRTDNRRLMHERVPPWVIKFSKDQTNHRPKSCVTQVLRIDKVSPFAMSRISPS